MEYLTWEPFPQEDGSVMEIANCGLDEHGWIQTAVRVQRGFSEINPIAASAVFFVTVCQGEGFFKKNSETLYYDLGTVIRVTPGDMFYISHVFEPTELLLKRPPALRMVQHG